jgi:hypothetical protein
MAYRRSYRRPRTTRRAYTKRRGGGRPRYTRRKPTYRRKGMSKRSILNTTSRKKRDDMLTASNTSSIGSAAAMAIQPLNVTGNQPYFGIWCATARSLFGGGNPDSDAVYNQSNRTSTTCYMRGLAENCRVQTNTSIPWFWRRICFTTKDFDYVGTTGVSNYVRSTAGMLRQYQSLGIAGQDPYVQEVQDNLFKGQQNVDWNDLITAKVDTNRVTLKYDRTITIRSGNAVGTAINKKFWFPMNANLVYNDDENGPTTTSTFGSVSSKPGMGNYIICDIIQPGASGAGSVSDIFRLQAEACLYWHEK